MEDEKLRQYHKSHFSTGPIKNVPYSQATEYHFNIINSKKKKSKHDIFFLEMYDYIRSFEWINYLDEELLHEGKNIDVETSDSCKYYCRGSGRKGTLDNIYPECIICNKCKQKHLTSKCHPVIGEKKKYETYEIFTSKSSCVILARKGLKLWTMYSLKNGFVEKGDYILGKLFIGLIRMDGIDLEYVYYDYKEDSIFICRSKIPNFLPYSKVKLEYRHCDDDFRYQKIKTRARNVSLRTSPERLLKDDCFNLYRKRKFIFGGIDYEIVDHKLMIPSRDILIHTFDTE